MNIGLLVDGMTRAIVQQNTITRLEPKGCYADHPMKYSFACKSGNAVGDLGTTNGHTSGAGMQYLQNATAHTCIGHSAP